MIHADYLFLLTDVDGLYTSNPRKDPSARQIEVVNSISAIRLEGGIFTVSKMIFMPLIVSTTTLGSSLGTGGMETKLIAAEIATAAGVTTIITSSKRPENIFSIIEYHARYSPMARPLSASMAPLPSPGHDTSGPKHQQYSSSTPSSGTSSPAPLQRPPHTVFTASPTPMRDLKSWTSHTLFPSGSVIIDAGAHHVLSKRESGGRLLAAGVVGVVGAFASGQAVRIVIRRHGGQQEDERKAYARALEITRPNTPTQGSTEVLEDDLTPAELEGEVAHMEEDILEVGRGLANYNSAQILSVKGLNRCIFDILLTSKLILTNYLITSTVHIFLRCLVMQTQSMS